MEIKNIKTKKEQFEDAVFLIIGVWLLVDVVLLAIHLKRVW